MKDNMMNNNNNNNKSNKNRVLFPVDCRFLEHGLCLWTTVVLLVLSQGGGCLVDGASLLWMTVFAVVVEEVLVVPYAEGLGVHDPREALSNGLAAGSCVVPWIYWTTGGSGQRGAVLGSIAILLYICIQYGWCGGRFPTKGAGIAVVIYLVMGGYGCAVTSLMSVCCFYGITTYLPRTCTLGESIALSSAIVQLGWYTWMMHGRGDAVATFIQGTLSLGVLLFVTGVVLFRNKNYYYSTMICITAVLFCIGGYILDGVAHLYLIQDNTYQTNMIRVSLVLYWVVVLVISLPFMSILKQQKTTSVPNSIHRKGFHLLALLLFVPSLMVDPGLLAISLAIAFVGFVMLEIMRIGNIRLFGSLDDRIYTFMASFIDDRDQGEVYMTHITLLLGLAVPIWLSAPYSIHTTYATVLSFAGIIATGVGDAMASTIGTLHGTMRIATRTSKTLQGTCASIASMLLCWYLLDTFFLDGIPRWTWVDWMWLSCMTTASALFESITDQFDNVFVSAHYYVLLRCIFT